MTSWLAFLLALVALRFLPADRAQERVLRPQTEVGIAVLLGGLFAGLACGWFSRFHLTGPTISSDFYDFCSAVGQYRSEDWRGYSQDRSYLAGWLPGTLSKRVGVVEALAWSAVLATWVMGIGLYSWARALHSRLAGVYTLLFALGIAPLVVLGRTLTFYPQYVACFCLSAGLTAVAVRFRSLRNLAAAVTSVGLCLLIDVRGVVWAAPNLAVLALFYLPQPKKKAAISAAIATAILALFWWGGSRAYSPDHTSLDDQANPVRLYNEHKPQGQPLLTDPGPAGIPNFVWGRTPIQDIPKTLFLLGKDTQKVAPGLSQVRRTQEGRKAHFYPWYGLVSLLGCLALFGPGHRRMRIVTFALTSSPFFVVLYHASTLEFRARFAASALPPFAILLGVGAAALWAGKRSAPPEQASLLQRLRHHWPSGLRVAVLTALIFGLVPNYLSPNADWRQRFVTDQEVLEMRQGALGGKQPEAWGSEACVEAIREDWKNGRPPLGRLYY